MKHIPRRSLVLTICTVLNLLCAFLINYIGHSKIQVLHLGSYVISTISMQGIFSALQTLTCILMVFASYKVGIVIAVVLSSQSLISSLMPIVRFHSLSSLPGVVSTGISVVSLLIIYSFYKQASLNSITDYITGLRNRRSYAREMTERLNNNSPLALVCVEIESFKQINNDFGMQAGDFILQQVAHKFTEQLGKSDMVFTITGPTFAIVFDDVKSMDEALEKAKELIKPQPMTIILSNNSGETGKTCMVTFAAGLTFIENPTFIHKNASAILKDAETAMLATRNSDTKVCVFDETMENAEAKQKEAEFLIRESLENDYFYLVYQPQFTTGKKELRGFETLIRCKKPDGSIVSPGYFIPAAEKTNLIIKIDDYVLRRAMTEFKPILASMKKGCILSVNVSAKNIGSEHFAEKVKKMLEETQFPPKSLEIEITEYSFADSMEITIANIQALRALGVQIALDDFGTGYTSIAQLMKLPVNLLKIDKSLIDDIETNQTMRDMVDSVIYMGHIMNCEVISEGVENENQLAMLKEHNCDFIQGFVWGKPQSFTDAKRLCQQEGA